MLLAVGERSCDELMEKSCFHGSEGGFQVRSHEVLVNVESWRLGRGSISSACERAAPALADLAISELNRT